MNHPLSVFVVTATVLVAAEPTLQLAPFHSIDVPHSGHVTLRSGEAQRVTLVKGSRDYTRVAAQTACS